MKFKPNIVWNPKCVPGYVNTYSPSWKKPREFVNHISDFADRAGVPFHESPSSRVLLKRVHSRSYVDDVMSGEAQNGFGTMDPTVADSCTYTCGAMVEGVMRAKAGWTSCAPVSGFHHAGYDFGGGFCTFNGLALAAIVADEFELNPGIVDCDQHYGNGTDDILTTLDRTDIPHFTYGHGYGRKEKSEQFLKDLPGILYTQFETCGVLLYQAGMDPFIDDPLGGCLTEEQLQTRDRIVFEFAKDNNIPMVWCLAGGYTKPFSTVLRLHENTFKIWLASNQ